MQTSFTVLGAGAWGTAVALLLANDPRHRVVLWSSREENGRDLRARRENVRLLPGVRIPESVELTTEIAQATASADLLVAAVPTVYLRETLAHIWPHVRSETP